MYHLMQVFEAHQQNYLIFPFELGSVCLQIIDTNERLHDVIPDSDSDWEIEDFLNENTSRLDEELSDRSDTDDDYYSDNDIEDLTWMNCCVGESTWKVADEGVRSSTRQRYQQRPLL